MSMATTCPSCLTTFRVTPQQLQAHRGMVRCGRCAAVFDGFKSLSTLPDESVAWAPQSPLTEDEDALPSGTVDPEFAEAPSTAAAEPEAEGRIEEQQPDDGATGETSADRAPPADEEKSEILAPREPQVPDTEERAPDAERQESAGFPDSAAAISPLTAEAAPQSDHPAPATGATAPELDSAAATSLLSADASRHPDNSAANADPAASDRIDVTPVLRAKPPASKLREPALGAENGFDFTEELPRRRNVGWRVGVGVLAVVLAAQGVYLFRSDIAANVPELRPALNKVCEKLRCTVPLPQRPRQISIEASDMQATDPADPGHITLTATLRNHAAVELAYPALDVVLTNAKEHTVARRIFMPAEYLGGKRNSAAGMKPNAELTIRLELDTGDLAAAGFRLDLLPAA